MEGNELLWMTPGSTLREHAAGSCPPLAKAQLPTQREQQRGGKLTSYGWGVAVVGAAVVGAAVAVAAVGDAAAGARHKRKDDFIGGS